MQAPSFDTWTTIFLFAAIQGLFVAVVLFFIKKENRKANALLASLIFLFSVTLIEYVLYWTRYQIMFPHTMAISEGFPFLFGVILYFYFKCVFENHRFSARDWVHLLPFVLFVVWMAPRYLTAASVKHQWLMGNFNVPPSLFHWPAFMGLVNGMHWVKIIFMSFYIYLILKKYNALSKTNHEVRLWFSWLVGLFAAFILSYTSYFILVNFSFFNNQWDYMISFSMMFTIYFIAWFGYLQPKIFSGFTLQESIVEPQRYKNSALDGEVSREILAMLNEAMQGKKLYRESDLRLERLAEAVGTTKHYLSQVINEQTGMNFFEYINSLRISEAQQLLAEKTKQEMNIIDVAYRVGFNNKVSFNNTFKKITGKTPTEFRKATSEEESATIQ